MAPRSTVPGTTQVTSSTHTDKSSAAAGTNRTAAPVPTTPLDTNAQVAETGLMGLKSALERRQLNAASPY